MKQNSQFFFLAMCFLVKERIANRYFNSLKEKARQEGLKEVPYHWVEKAIEQFDEVKQLENKVRSHLPILPIVDKHQMKSLIFTHYPHLRWM